MNNAFAQLETVSHKLWRKKTQRCNNYLLTAHLWSSASGEVPASPIDSKSQYLHPLKLLAYSLRGPSTEFHSSAGPSQWSRCINTVLNLKTGPDWFHLDLNTVQTTTFRCPDAFFFFSDTKRSLDATGWVNNKLTFSTHWTSADADVHLCDVCRDSIQLFCVQVSCQDPSAHCWFRSGREKTLRAEEQNASIFRVCANYVVICCRQKIMAHFSFHLKTSSRGRQTKEISRSQCWGCC